MSYRPAAGFLFAAETERQKMYSFFRSVDKITNIVMIFITILTLFLAPYGAALFVIYVATLEIYWFTRLKSPKEVHGIDFTDSEMEVYKKYWLHFQYPSTSRTYSSTLSMIQLSSIGIAILLALKGYYVAAIVLGLNYFIAGPLSMRMNPSFFYSNAKRISGNQSKEIDDLNSISTKMQENRQKGPKPDNTATSNERTWEDIEL